MSKIFVFIALTLLGNLLLGQLQQGEWTYHQIKSGETAFGLARKYKVSLSELKQWNQFLNLNYLQAGNVLKVYQPSGEPLTADAATRSLASDGGASDANVQVTSPQQARFHQIKSGDTFYGVARFYNLSTNQLRAFNPSLDPNRLSVGERIVIGYGSLGEESSGQMTKSLTSNPSSPANAHSTVSHMPQSRMMKEHWAAYESLVEFRDRFKVYAVVVGVSDYPNVRKLRYPDDDAYLFYSFLLSLEGGVADHNDISILVDENATRENILHEMKRLFSQADEDDITLLYYAGHGIENAIIPYNYDGANAVTFEDIYPLFQTRSQHRAVFLDACYSGSLTDKYLSYSKERDERAAAQKENAINQLDKMWRLDDAWIMVSSGSDEVSIEVEGIRHGVFTYAVVSGLRGAADVNKDYLVTLQELFNYVSAEVLKYSQSNQHPILLGNYNPHKVYGLLRKK